LDRYEQRIEIKKEAVSDSLLRALNPAFYTSSTNISGREFFCSFKNWN
jgi:hypothetical protein